MSTSPKITPTKDLETILDYLYLGDEDRYTPEAWEKHKAGAKALLQAWATQQVVEAQLQILRGFRRRDFKLDSFYETAVIDRLQALQHQQENTNV